MRLKEIKDWSEYELWLYVKSLTHIDPEHIKRVLRIYGHGIVANFAIKLDKRRNSLS